MLEQPFNTLVSFRLVTLLCWFSFLSSPRWIELINPRSMWNCIADLKPIVRGNLKTGDMICEGGWWRQQTFAALFLFRAFVSFAQPLREMSKTASKGWKITQEKMFTELQFEHNWHLSCQDFVDGAVTSVMPQQAIVKCLCKQEFHLSFLAYWPKIWRW